MCDSAGVSDPGMGRAEGLLGLFEGTESRRRALGVTEGVETGEGQWWERGWSWDAERGETEEEVDVGRILDLRGISQ